MGKEVIFLNINETIYKVQTIVSISIIEIILSKKDENKTYENRVAEAIIQSIQLDEQTNLPTIKNILDEGEYIFTQYIEALIKDDDVLEDNYAKIPKAQPICERFYNALNEYTSDSLNELTEIIKKNIAIPHFNFDPLGELLLIASETIIKLSKNISAIFDNFIKIQKENLINIKKLLDFDEKDWDKIVYSYQKWGEFGWTIIQHAPFNFFSTPPESRINADKQALKYFNKNQINNLFNELKGYPIDKKDLESAIFCFENKHYKPSAMLLCAMIEAPLITVKPNIKRKVGIGAVNIIKENIKNIDSIKSRMVLFLHIENTIYFLYNIFQNTNNFNTEPKYINRNFINHGMSKRNVLKKDCIKLFLGLYNIYFMLDLIKDNEEI